MSKEAELKKKLDECPSGIKGWKQFEDICTEILEYLFCPPLKKPKEQIRTLSGVSRRDMIFPNRNIDVGNTLAEENWHLLLVELDARMILFEYKNYGKSELGPNAVIQASDYLTETIGRLGIIVSTKKPNDSALQKRNTIYSNYKKVILFLTKADLKEMLDMKERGDEPSEFIVDKEELFFLQHE